MVDLASDYALPTEYSTPGYAPTIPGADWFIEGRRFREVHRVGNRTHLRLIEE